MQNDNRPTILYAVAAGLLGIITFIAALVWHNSLQTVVSGTATSSAPAAGIISGILIFIGIILILYGLLVLTIGWFRSHHQSDSLDVPPDVLQQKPDASLQVPQSQPKNAPETSSPGSPLQDNHQ